MAEGNLVQHLLQMMKALNSSLRLKDVLETAVAQFVGLAGEAKVAIFLSDNDSLSLKLMTARGYSDASQEQLRSLSFSSESLLKPVVQKRQLASISDPKQAPDISASIMKREGSRAQIGLPLIASNLLVGAMLIDLPDGSLLGMLDLLKQLSDLVAISVANAILFGRSEYERERLGTLYKTSVSLSGSSLKTADVLQIAADTSLILANTPHCAVLLIDRNKGQFSLAAFKGLDGGSMSDFDLSLEDTLAGRSLMSGKTEYVNDATSIQLSLPRSTGGALFGSAIAVPIVAEHQALAVLMLFSQEMRGFHREQIDLLESLAQQVANALNIALTHESATSQTVQDAHTGLYNPWHFVDSINKEMERSLRHKHDFAVLRIDIDHLTRVNDLLGPGKGDEAIKHVAKLVKNCLRDIDIPCRFGSQEFAVILPETSRQAAFEVAERLRAKIRSESAPGVGMVTVSVGMASYPENGDSPESLVKAAEQALDIAKFEGRDRVKLAESGMQAEGHISWDELARQAKLAVLSERQSKLQSRLQVPAEYAPWMRAVPNWGTKKKDA
ncbi:MAG: diguanylate cyclase [Candidatus Obscuribacterales bacterium]|nr:diguanylate cyclase [Candidatus Obscuribacterales bacterium]